MGPIQMLPQTCTACTLHVLSIAGVVNVDAFWRETIATRAKQLRTVHSWLGLCPWNWLDRQRLCDTTMYHAVMISFREMF